MNILVINPGAVSTKVAVFSQGKERFSHSLPHSAKELAPFPRILDQTDYRLRLVLQDLAQSGVALSELDAVCGRGGLFKHLPSGTYRVDADVLHDVYHPPYGEHASNLGVVLADAIGRMAGIPAYFVDPVSVDELQDVARLSGFKGMPKESFFHALNQKAVARRAAASLGKPYESLNLLVAHLGGGVSVAAHRKGRIVDVTNIKDDGSMSMDRGGSLPVNALIRLCFSGKSREEVRQLLGSEAGVYSYLGTKDFREVEARMDAGDRMADLVFRAFAYQLAKDIGAMAAVLRYQADALVFTGGLANSKRFLKEILSYVEGLAPVLVFPGEEEMRALAEGAQRVLDGEAAKIYGETCVNTDVEG